MRVSLSVHTSLSLSHRQSFLSMAQLVLFLTCLFLASVVGLNCRVLGPAVPENNPILLVSDGFTFTNQQKILSLEPPKINRTLAGEACVHLYGFLPCAENGIGYAFQVFSYGCLLIFGDYFLSKGRAELLDIFEVGLYGALVFPLLEIFPLIAFILVNALSTTPEVAQSMIVGFVGATVGTSVFSLTIQWGACILFGTIGVCDTGSDQKQENPTKPRPGLFKRLLESSVDTDSRTKKGARIMLLTLIPFLIVQLSELFDSRSWRHIIVLMTLIVSAFATLLQLALLLFDTSGQQNCLDLARFELMAGVKKNLQTYSLERILQDGQLTRESLKNLFEKFDTDHDGKLDIYELNEFTLEFGKLGKLKCDMDALAKTVLKEFDQDEDGMVNEDEFAEGITKWLKERKTGFVNCAAAAVAPTLKVEEQKNRVGYALIATIKVIGGILIVVLLVQPFMMNISLLSISAGIPSFFVAFAAIPLARNLKNALSLNFCSTDEKQNAASLTFSQIYMDVTMNNLMGMSMILAIVYGKGLTWNCSTEVLIVVVFGLIVGVPASITSSYPLWASPVAIGSYIIPFILIAHHYSS